MLNQIKAKDDATELLPGVPQTWVFELRAPEPKMCSIPPIVGGFQMLLPGISGSNPDESELENSLDWHCYLGSK